MTKRTHTPGPWTRDGSLIVAPSNGHADIVYEGGLAAAIVCACEHTDGDRWATDTDLITAAPELLVALEDLVRAVDLSQNDMGIDVTREAHAAIAKAKGDR